MKYIEEKIFSPLAANVVWKAWFDHYMKAGVKIGEKKFVMQQGRKAVKFKIEEIKKNESLTIVWYSHFLKLIFYHKVEKAKNGSLITCRVQIKGFLAFILRPFISKKIRQNLQMSLKQFTRNQF